MGAAVLILGAGLASCSDDSNRGSATTSAAATSTVPASASPQVPTLGSKEEAELQARSMLRAFDPAYGLPVCGNASPRLRAAIEEVFPVEVEFIDSSSPPLWTEGSMMYRCLVLGTDHVEVFADDVVGIDVFQSSSRGGAVGRNYLFRWDGSTWRDTTPEETGITTTTAVE